MLHSSLEVNRRCLFQVLAQIGSLADIFRQMIHRDVENPFQAKLLRKNFEEEEEEEDVEVKLALVEASHGKIN